MDIPFQQDKLQLFQVSLWARSLTALTQLGETNTSGCISGHLEWSFHIFSVNGWGSTNPFIYCPQTRALLTSLCSNTGTGHSIPAFPPARGSLHPLIPWNHLPGQHLHLLLFCWCLCEQEQRSLQRLSTIPLTDHSIWDNYISSSFARKKGKQWEAN